MRVTVLIWAAVELALMTLLVLQARPVVRGFRRRRREGEGEGLVASLEGGLADGFRHRLIARLVAAELIAIGLALAGPFVRAPAEDDARFFMHRRRHFGAVVALLAFLLVVETVAVHLLLRRGSPVAAWIASGLSAYVLVWLAGDYHALRLQPLRVTGDALRVELGVRWRARVPWVLIERLEPADTRPADRAGLLDASVLAPDLLITLREPVVATGIYGWRKRVTRILLSVDRPEALVAAVRARAA